MDTDEPLEESMMAADDAEFMSGVMRVMLLWTAVVVAAGFVLVILRDPVAALFVLAGAF